MASQKQIEANQRNARMSTGPRTPEGKRNAALNALKHGLRADTRILPGEDEDSYAILYQTYIEAYEPTDGVELSLIRQMVDAEWRLQRYVKNETSFFWFRYNCAEGDLIGHRDRRDLPAKPQTKEEWDDYRSGRMLQSSAEYLSTLSRYEASLRRAFFQALQTIETRRQIRARMPQPVADMCEVVEPEPLPRPRLAASPDRIQAPPEELSPAAIYAELPNEPNSQSSGDGAPSDSRRLATGPRPSGANGGPHSRGKMPNEPNLDVTPEESAA